MADDGFQTQRGHYKFMVGLNVGRTIHMDVKNTGTITTAHKHTHTQVYNLRIKLAYTLYSQYC